MVKYNYWLCKLEGLFHFRIGKDDLCKNCKKKEVTENLFDLLAKYSENALTDIFAVIDNENTEIQKFNSEKEFCIQIFELQKIRLLFKIKSVFYHEEEHLLLYLDKNCFGYHHELYNGEIVQKENTYLLYNYGFIRSGLNICQTYFDKKILVDKIMDEILLCGSSLYESLYF